MLISTRYTEIYPLRIKDLSDKQKAMNREGHETAMRIANLTRDSQPLLRFFLIDIMRELEQVPNCYLVDEANTSDIPYSKTSELHYQNFTALQSDKHLLENTAIFRIRINTGNDVRLVYTKVEHLPQHLRRKVKIQEFLG
jgi:hypothetical protein